MANAFISWADAMVSWAVRAIQSVFTLANDPKEEFFTLANYPKEECPGLPSAMSLSDLPEGVILDILSRLPTKDAGRTAVLSRFWRHLWRCVPDLDLSGVSDLGVSQALRLHVGPIRLFKVDRTDGCTIDRWLSTLSSSSSCCCLHTLDLSRPYRLQLGTLACSFPRLAHLRLAYGIMAMLLEGDSPEFPILQTLDLDLVYPYDIDYLVGIHSQLQLSMFVPACPLLEKLTLRHGDFEGETYFCYDLSSIARDYPRLTHLQLSDFRDFTIPSSSPRLTSLRTLSLDQGTIYGDISVLFSACPLLENLILNRVYVDEGLCLDIVAPHLRFLKLVEVTQVKDFSISGAPLLEEAIISLSIGGETGGETSGETSTNCNMMKVLGGIPCIKKIELHTWFLPFLEKGYVPENFSISFDQLKYMSLWADLDDVRELRVTLCLLRSAPNLRELDMQGSYSYKEFQSVGKDFWKAQEHLGLFDNLETVNVTDLYFGAEIEFIRFVLSKARVLKTMRVSIGHWPTKKEILMFPRVSNQAKIIFT